MVDETLCRSTLPYDVNKVYRILDNLCYRKDGCQGKSRKTQRPDYKSLVTRTPSQRL